jgi:hypothetical protein
MKNKDLIKALQELDPEMDVCIYIGNGEEGDKLSSVKIVTPDNEPYSKGDKCYEMHDNLTNPCIFLLSR